MQSRCFWVGSISLAKDGEFLGGLAAKDAWPGSTGLFQRDTAQRSFGGFLNLLLATALAAPARSRKALFHRIPELLEILGLERVRIAKGERPLQQRFLNRGEQLRNRCRDAFLGNKTLP